MGVAATARDLVPDVLDEYGAVVREALKSHLGPAEPRRYLYYPVSDYPLRGGRMLRPSLLIATARAFGADLDSALDSAVVIVWTKTLA